MDQQSQQSALARAEKSLNPKELEAYKKHVQEGKACIAPSTAANFFQLYLTGQSCEEIARAYPAFSLGLIARAKVDHDWDKQREDYIVSVLTGIRQVVQKTQLDAIRFVAEGMAVFQKMAGEKFRAYLRTGDIKELGDFKDMNFKSYKELLELMLKLTGQNSEQQVHGEITHKHLVEPADGLRTDKPMTEIDAAAFLKSLEKEKQ